LIRGEKTGAEQLMEAFAMCESPIMALEKVADKRVSSYGIVEAKNTN
jgi:UTP-glucose-1-phosphate uridylyltransferase